MTKKRSLKAAAPKAAAPGQGETPEPKPPIAPPPEPPPPAAPPSTPPSSPPAPPAGAWPIFKLGEGYVVGGRSVRPGPPPQVRERSDDPDGVRRGLFDVRGARKWDEHDLPYPDVKTVVPY
jgi:hypothetical protein